jgi:hypothetical protein
VGGPVAGFILLQFYYHISAYSPKHIRGKGWRRKFEFRRRYEELKLKCTEDDRKELEELEGRHYFGKCTGIALVLIGLYGLVFFILPYPGSGALACTSILSKGSILCNQEFELRSAILIIIFGLAAILYFGAYYEYRRVHLPIICALMNKHSFWPETCEISKRAEYDELIDETFRRFSSHMEEECKEALQGIQSELNLERKIGRISPTFYNELTEKICKKIAELN